MLPAPPVERLTLPALPAPAARSGFPVVATLAPVVVSLVLWMLTQSVYSLLFAVLGPVVAVGGLVDGRVNRRRTARRDRVRYVAALDRVADAVGDAHERERGRLRRLAPDPGSLTGWVDERGMPLAVTVGRGTLAARVELIGDDPEDAGPVVAMAIRDLRDSAARLRDAPILVDARAGIGVTGPPVLAAAVARALAVQVAARLSPVDTVVSAPPGEGWTANLPHASVVGDPGRYSFREGDDDPVSVSWAAGEAGLALGCGIVVDSATAAVTGGRGETVVDLLPGARSSAEAAESARALRVRAAARGLRPAGGSMPARVALADLLLLAPQQARGSLSAPIGRDGHGPVVVDLVAEGPHAVIAGTTGSGKSELLVSWVLGMAAGRSPAEVAFLLVDFKGGSAFAPLAVLPHVVATLSDLDARLTRRAIESLRAELLRRERELAAAGARSIDDLPAGSLPRLVIVVDEFAAMVAASPELHEVFADLAARGRSLGLHLILCTQRPAGVIRDAVLANVTLRMSLRVNDRADSVAMLGTDAAAGLPAEPRGRGILLRDGEARAVQVAIARPEDAVRIAADSPTAAVRTPWCEPLPHSIALESLPPVERGLAFGLLDPPAEQQQPTAVFDPLTHGHLLVLGGAGAGSTTALETLVVAAVRAGVPVRRVPSEPADAWAVVVAETRPSAESRLLMLDDLDALIARFDADHRHEFLELLTDLARRSGSVRSTLVVAAHRLTGPLAGIAGLFGSRLLLRQTSREEHVLAGADPRAFDPELPPGAGTWRGAVVQVAQAGESQKREAIANLDDATPRPMRVVPAEHRVLAVVAGRPRAHLDSFRSIGARVVELGRGTTPAIDELHIATAPTPTVLLGDPEAWLAEWSLLAAARRDWPIVLVDVGPADHRALLRERALPPPLGADPGECWLAVEGRTVRAILALT